MHEARSSCALLLVLAWAASAAASPVFVGVAARGEAQGEPAVRVSRELASALEEHGVGDVSSTRAATANEETASTLGADASKARELYGRAEFEGALAVIDEALERFESRAAFLGDEATWKAVLDLLALRALTLARVDREREERATVRRLLALRPDFAPDPGDFPPGFVERVEKERKRLDRAAGVVRVESAPEGARVRVDGREVGAAPTVVEALPRGVHFVAVEGEGDRHEQRVTLDGGDVVVRARLGDPRRFAAESVRRALDGGLSEQQLVEVASTVGPDVIVAVLTGALEQQRLVVARVKGGTVSTVTAGAVPPSADGATSAIRALADEVALGAAGEVSPGLKRELLGSVADDEGGVGGLVAAAIIGGGVVLVVGAVAVGAVVIGRLEAERGFYVRVDTSGL